MVQLFQRYVPYSSVLDFVVQSLLCMTAFTLTVQVAWWTHLDPTLPDLTGMRIGRTLTTVSVLVLVFYLTGYFERRHHLSTSMYVPRLMQSVPLAAATLALLYTFVPTVALSWAIAATGLTLMTALMVGWHALAPAVVKHGALAENILLIGDGDLAAQISRRIMSATPWGFKLAGFIPVGETSGTHETPDRNPCGPSSVGGSSQSAGSRAWAAPGQAAHARVLHFPRQGAIIDAPSLGRLQDLEDVIHERDIHSVVVALNDRRGKLPLASLVNAKLRGVSVYDAVDFYERLTGRMMVARMRPSTIIFSEGFSPSRATQATKRLVDVLAALGLLLTTLPLQALIALAVKLTSRGPVLFRQDRVGLNGRPFTMVKFRTMREDAERDGPVWARQDDDRITPIGGLLRKSRLDELPQVWNVLLGQMSFVGPRPERPVFVNELRQQIPYYDQRHTVRPGITGWAQVKYPYGASVEEALEKLEYDLYYIKRMSVAFDLTIIVETVRVLITGKGAR